MAISMEGINPYYIGAMCHEFRRYRLHVNQQEIADDCAVSRETVSKFEQGKVQNTVVFMWYIKNGLFEWMAIDRWVGFNYRGE